MRARARRCAHKAWPPRSASRVSAKLPSLQRPNSAAKGPLSAAIRLWLISGCMWFRRPLVCTTYPRFQIRISHGVVGGGCMDGLFNQARRGKIAKRRGRAFICVTSHYNVCRTSLEPIAPPMKCSRVHTRPPRQPRRSGRRSTRHTATAHIPDSSSQL